MITGATTPNPTNPTFATHTVQHTHNLTGTTTALSYEGAVHPVTGKMDGVGELKLTAGGKTYSVFTTTDPKKTGSPGEVQISGTPEHLHAFVQHHKTADGINILHLLADHLHPRTHNAAYHNRKVRADMRAFWQRRRKGSGGKSSISNKDSKAHGKGTSKRRGGRRGGTLAAVRGGKRERKRRTQGGGVVSLLMRPGGVAPAPRRARGARSPRRPAPAAALPPPR